LAVFNPNRQFAVTGNPSGFPNTFGLTPGEVKSDSKWFVVPSIGMNWMMNDVDAIGVSIYGNGGMNTNYDTNAFLGSQPTGVDLSQLFFGLTYSRKLASKHSVGVTGIFSFQRFKAEGLDAFTMFSSDGTKLTNNDYSTSTGFGARIGYYGQILPFLSIGASYQTKMSMSEFDDYAGLFAEKGDFDIPASWNAGIAITAIEDIVIGFDIQQILYSGITSINNPFKPADFQQGILLGSTNGAGFGWDDMMIYKFGAQWQSNSGWTWRAGYSIGEQPIPESEVLFNILAPGVTEQHVTFGLSKTIWNQEINFSIMRAFSNTVSGTNPMEAPDQQTIELKMDQWEFEIGLSF